MTRSSPAPASSSCCNGRRKSYIQWGLMVVVAWSFYLRLLVLEDIDSSTLTTTPNAALEIQPISFASQYKTKDGQHDLLPPPTTKRREELMDTDRPSPTTTTSDGGSNHNPPPVPPPAPAYTHLENRIDLPGFIPSNRGYVLGATLTRDELHSTMFIDLVFMGMKVFTGGGSFRSAWDRDYRWEEASGIMTVDIKEWENRCLLHLPKYQGESMKPQQVVVVPTWSSIDGNVNDMVNIIRCEVPRGMQEFISKYHTGTIEVELLEAIEQGSKLVPMVNLTLPIDTRTTGYIRYPEVGSKLDFWQTKKDDIHMCVPGLRSSFVYPLPEMVTEFLEYHIMMGVNHFYFGVDYDWGSQDMERVLILLDRYIKEGYVSVSSTNVIRGAGIDSELKKTYFYNQCLFHAKSMATWVGIWDTDELVVPRQPDMTLLTLIDHYTNDRIMQGRDVGFLLFTSYSHASPKVINPHLLWMGERFAETRESWHDDAWQKSLLSSKHIYFTGFHLPGGCTADGRDWNTLVRDDDPLYHSYCRKVAKEEAGVFHYRQIMAYSEYIRSPSLEKSEYSLYYFNATLDRIRARGMDKLCATMRVTSGYNGLAGT